MWASLRLLSRALSSVLNQPETGIKMKHLQRRIALNVAAPAPVAAAPAAAPMTQPTPQQQQAIKQACRADYQANCAGVPTGGQAALSCLQQNAANTSPGCQQALGGGGEPAAAAAAPAAGMTQPTAQQQQAIKQACRSDFQKQCAGVPTGGQAALSCLQQNAANTSPGCQQALSGGGGDAGAAAAAPAGAAGAAGAAAGGVLLRGRLRRQAW